MASPGSPVGSPTGPGTPAPVYAPLFASLNGFSEIASPQDGLKPGAVEELGNRVCTR